MRIVPIESIVVPPDRIRKDFDPEKLAELAESITNFGLFHALLVRDDGKTLIAGERRLRTIQGLYSQNASFNYDGKQVAFGLVPVVSLCELDAAAVLEAELHENIRRQQLTWQEQALATNALHSIRKSQNPLQTISKTSKEIYNTTEQVNGPVRMKVSYDVLVAQYLDDPEVAKAPNRKEALRIIERRLTQGHREALAKAFGESIVHDRGECHLGKMQDLMLGFPDKSFDCIIADPPYGIDANTFANQSAVEHTYADDREHSDTMYGFIAREGFLKCKDEAHAYLFCDPRRFESISRIFSSRGWRVWPWPLIWWRGTQVGLLPWPEHGPRRTYETILYALKGDRRTTGVFPDVLNVPHDSSTERGAHKPPALYTELIKRTCLPGDRVLDPCCGTGPIFEAARFTNTYGVGIELEPAAYTQALNRLRGIEEE